METLTSSSNLLKQLKTSSRPEARSFIARRSGETLYSAFVPAIACFLQATDQATKNRFMV
ncbi:MAG TPA: hypothetical protein VK638_28705 [Edaphobacter sp.]|nr:hypothetical protein [Edaphobacter sp.]